MGSNANRLRKKWQDYGGSHATDAEHNFYDVFKDFFDGTEYEIESQPKCFRDIYVDVELPKDELNEIYTPPEPIKHHGIKPDALIRNTLTGKEIYVEVKRQDGWVEGKERKAGRGNAHERLCKYFTPGLLDFLRQKSHIEKHYPFWIVFQGDITRAPCRVREISFWFGEHKANYFFWRNTKDAKRLIEHFVKNIAPLLE